MHAYLELSVTWRTRSPVPYDTLVSEPLISARHRSPAHFMSTRGSIRGAMRGGRGRTDYELLKEGQAELFDEESGRNKATVWRLMSLAKKEAWVSWQVDTLRSLIPVMKPQCACNADLLLTDCSWLPNCSCLPSLQYFSSSHHWQLWPCQNLLESSSMSASSSKPRDLAARMKPRGTSIVGHLCAIGARAMHSSKCIAHA